MCLVCSAGAEPRADKAVLNCGALSSQATHPGACEADRSDCTLIICLFHGSHHLRVKCPVMWTQDSSETHSWCLLLDLGQDRRVPWRKAWTFALEPGKCGPLCPLRGQDVLCFQGSIFNPKEQLLCSPRWLRRRAALMAGLWHLGLPTMVHSEGLGGHWAHSREKALSWDADPNLCPRSSSFDKDESLKSLCFVP